MVESPVTERYVTGRRKSMLALLALTLTGCGEEPSIIKPTAFHQADLRRGEYLTENFACQECHTVREKDGITLDRTLLFAGGVPFHGPDGSVVYTANVTLASQYPEQLIDATIRGRLAYKFAMPTHVFNRMASDDMRDMTAYLKTLRPVLRPLPDNYLPANLALRAPHSPVPVPEHAPAPGTLEHGEYLSRMCLCQDCHSPRDSTGAYAKDRLFAGGMRFQLEGDRYIVTPDLTQSPDTGLGRWSAPEIVRAIRTGIARNGRKLDEFMPYSTAFHSMSTQDIDDLVRYLRSLAPAKRVPSVGASSLMRLQDRASFRYRRTAGLPRTCRQGIRSGHR